MSSVGPSSSLDVESLIAENAALRDRNELLTAVIRHCPAVIFVKDTEGRLILCNTTYEVLVGAAPGGLVGKTDSDIFGREAGDQIRTNDLRVCESGAPKEVEELIPQSDGVHTYISVKFPLYDAHGGLYGLGGIATDITERRRAEDERNALQQKIIEVQRAVLSELSTPIVPIVAGIIALPLIGGIDSDRARAITQALLEGITHHRAHTAILDVTGVRAVDGNVAAAILDTARAARLLGTRVLVTGIRPEVAQAMVMSDEGWGSMECHGTLGDAVALALSAAHRR